MALFSSSQDDTVRFDAGQGSFSERTIELGGTVLAVQNIGSIRVHRGERNFILAIIGAILVLVGLVQLEDNGGSALLLAAVGVALIAINFMIKTELTLSIGTCDGRFTNITSTDKEFLGRLLFALKKKIDADGTAVTGNFDISARDVSVD